MEVRIWLPESLSALRYMVRHRSSFIIGAYGFDRWFKESQRCMTLRREITTLKKGLSQKNERLEVLGRELSKLKRKQ